MPPDPCPQSLSGAATTRDPRPPSSPRAPVPSFTPPTLGKAELGPIPVWRGTGRPEHHRSLPPTSGGRAATVRGMLLRAVSPPRSPRGSRRGQMEAALVGPGPLGRAELWAAGLLPTQVSAAVAREPPAKSRVLADSDTDLRPGRNNVGGGAAAAEAVASFSVDP